MWPVKLFFDLETTGFGKQAKIVQLGALVEFPDDEARDVPGPNREFCTFINPGFTKMQRGASEVTGITDDQLKTSPSFKLAWQHFCNFLEREIACRIPSHTCACKLSWIGYNNERFDNVVLRRELTSANLTWSWKSKIQVVHYTADLLAAVRLCRSHTLSGCANIKLQTVYEFLFHTKMVNAHDALADVRATRLIYIRNPNIRKLLSATPIPNADGHQSGHIARYFS